MRESKEGNSLTGWAAGQRRERMVLNHDQRSEKEKHQVGRAGASLWEEQMEPPRPPAGNPTDAKDSRGPEWVTLRAGKEEGRRPYL